jgi:hypothetical protein
MFDKEHPLLLREITATRYFCRALIIKILINLHVHDIITLSGEHGPKYRDKV